MASALPIGILDSGFGGLSVTRAIRARLPHESIVFAADCACAPYGDRDEAYILKRLEAVVGFLLERRVKAIVFACNTATAVGIRAFRERLEDGRGGMPIIGIEPAVFPAVRHTRGGVIGVLATSRTLASAKYRVVRDRALDWALVQRPMPVTIRDVPCPGLMECVERGEFNSPELHDLLRRYVDPLAAAGADEIVLGCTHYPFLAKAISAHAPRAHLIDPAPAVAEQLERRLAFLNLAAPPSTKPACASFHATGATSAREAVLRSLWPGEPRLLELA